MKTIGNSIIQSRKNDDDFWLKFEFEERCKGVHCVDLGESFLNLLFEPYPYSNEYSLAKIGVDTADNGPLKVCHKLPKSYKKDRMNIGMGHRRRP